MADPPAVPLGIADGLADPTGVVLADELAVTVGWVLGLGAVPLGEPPHAVIARTATIMETRFKCTR